jgi:hypothetical protein
MIEVLKQMVEAFDFDWTEEAVSGEWAGKAMNALDNAKKAIAELEKQKPVAWRAVNFSNDNDVYPWAYRDFDDPFFPLDAGQPLYTSPQPRKPLPVSPEHETNAEGWAVSAGGYCNIFICEDDADDWIMSKGGCFYEPESYTKRALVEAKHGIGDKS